MRTAGVLLALSTTMFFAPACQPLEQPCPAIAQASVVSLTVAPSYVSSVRSIQLKACQDGNCKEAELELRPGSVSIDQGCETRNAGPDAVCSATSSPDGTLVGMLMLDVLTESPIEATVNGTSPNGAPLPERFLTFTPKSDYPFGQHCGKFLSASLILNVDGLRQAD
jgi:hypothetical protein